MEIDKLKKNVDNLSFMYNLLLDLRKKTIFILFWY